MHLTFLDAVSGEGWSGGDMTTPTMDDYRAFADGIEVLS